ncbi:MAG: CHAD domain-containing protein [Planctomycetota bacterium]
MTWPMPPVSYPLADADHAIAIVAALSEWAPVITEDGPALRRTFFDTFDWRIHEAGGTLEVERAGWVWRTRDGSVPFGRRTGKPPAFAWDLPEGELRTALGKVIEMRRLLPRVCVAKRGRVVRVLDDEEKTVVRVAVESGTVNLPGEAEERDLPGRLTVLPVRGYVSEFRAVTAFLEGRFPLEADNAGDLETALAAAGRKPGDYSSKVAVSLTPDLPTADAMRLVHRSLLVTMLRNEEGTRADTDSEFLHDFRVSIRRTRSALTQVKGVFPEAEFLRFKEEFSRLGTATGPVRDLDVWLLKFDVYRRALPESAAVHLDALEEFLRAEQRREQRRLAKVLASERYRGLIEDWRQFLARATPTENAPPHALRPIRAVASERIHKVFLRVLERGAKITDETPGEALHRVRIDGKKLRYLLEFFRGLYDADEIATLIRALKQLQDVLGDFNDYEVQQASVKEFAARMAAAGKAPAETLMAMGRLTARLEKGQARERARFHERFRKFELNSGKKRVDRIFGGRRGAGS